MALHGHFIVLGCSVEFPDDRIQMAKTCRTEDLFNLPAAESIPATEECRFFHPNCPQPPLPGLPSSPPASKHRSRGGVRTAGREIGVWRDDYHGFHLFSLASVFSPARGGQGSPVTSGAIVTPHYSAPLGPPAGPLAACVVMETARQRSSSGLREKLSPSAGGQRGAKARRQPEHMVSAGPQDVSGELLPHRVYVHSLLPGWRSPNVMRIIRMRWWRPQ